MEIFIPIIAVFCDNVTMKKIRIIGLLVLAAISFAGCKKEKKDNSQQGMHIKVKKATAEELAIAEAKRQETADIPVASLLIPAEYKKNAEQGGTVEKISYETKDYFGEGGKITKHAYVYLPAGYSKDKKYPVMYLMHGIGGSEDEWGLKNDSSTVKRIMDNLIERGEIEPFIVITPNGRAASDFGSSDANYNSFYKFGQELRNDLIPYMDKNYSTKADRNGRAMAGLSMGGMQTINIGICECLDIISYFGAFSAAPTSYPAAQVAAAINEGSKYPVNYFYNICGLEDNIAYASHENAAKKIPELLPDFVEGENYTWKDVHGAHSFDVWYLGFYEFARIAFTKK